MSVAAVVVTFKRQVLLKNLFESYCNMFSKPDFIVIVDNENSEETLKIVDSYKSKLRGSSEVLYFPQTENLGGAGGFSIGTKEAYNLGVDWIWLMDDDVEVIPDALEKVQPFFETAIEDEHRVIQPRRINFDQTPFYWQYQFLLGLGIPNPIAPAKFDDVELFKLMNTACFEGGFIHRSIVFELGAPDPRFFIYWDDSVYGYLASKITNPILINKFCLKRTREIDNVKVGSFRKLNSTSDMVRYYIMRNRGFIAKYFALYGDYKRFRFGFGTFLTFIKEIIRLFVSKKNLKYGFKQIVRGMLDARKIYKDKSFKTIGPLV